MRILTRGESISGPEIMLQQIISQNSQPAAADCFRPLSAGHSSSNSKARKLSVPSNSNPRHRVQSFAVRPGDTSVQVAIGTVSSSKIQWFAYDQIGGGESHTKREKEQDAVFMFTLNVGSSSGNGTAAGPLEA